jgi:hypothetical protein
MDKKYKAVPTLKDLDLSRGTRTSIGSGKSTFSTQSKEDRYNEAFKNDFKSSPKTPPIPKKAPKKLPPLKPQKLSPLKNKPKTPKKESPPKTPKKESTKKQLFVWDAPISPAYNLKPFSKSTQEMENFREMMVGLEEEWAKDDERFEREREEEMRKQEESYELWKKKKEEEDKVDAKKMEELTKRIKEKNGIRKLLEMKRRPLGTLDASQTPTPPVEEPKKRGRPKGSKNKPKN